MQVKLNVTRRDIAWFNISKLFRIKTNLTVFAFALLIATIASWRGSVSDGGEIVWPALVIGSLFGGVIGFAAIFLFSLVFVLIGSNAKSGVLGEHTYTIEETGLREQTQANDTLNFWPAIEKIEKSRTAILVQINAWMFHVLPRRAFNSDVEFDAFFDALKARCQSKSP